MEPTGHHLTGIAYGLIAAGFYAGLDFNSFNSSTIILILVLGIVHGGAGFYLFFTGMNKLTGQSIAVLSYIDPLTSLIISALIIGEKMSLQQLIGAVLLLGSIWIGETQVRSKLQVTHLGIW